MFTHCEGGKIYCYGNGFGYQIDADCKILEYSQINYDYSSDFAYSISCIKKEDMCFACFDGIYPEHVPHNGLGSMDDEE